MEYRVMTGASAHIRSYRQERPDERHGFVQIVLPVRGRLWIDVAGRQEELSCARGVFIHSGTSHAQRETAGNHSLVVELDEHRVSERALERLSHSPFLDVASDTRHLIDFMRGVIGLDGCRDDVVGLWAPLLIDSLAGEKPGIRARLNSLAALVEAEPFSPWTIDRLATCVSISESRLHALFIEEFGLSPHRWLAGLRMRKVCALLENPSLPIVEIALRAGFSDQTALTRAMRHIIGETPAAYRRSRGIH